MLRLLLLRSGIASLLWDTATAFYHCHHTAAAGVAPVHLAQHQFLSQGSASAAGVHRSPHDQRRRQLRPSTLLRCSSSSDGSSGSGSAGKGTLGIAHHVLERTIVPGLAGAVLKESPSDFVVVEIPQQVGSTFTPADPEGPVPNEARKAAVDKVRVSIVYIHMWNAYM